MQIEISSIAQWEQNNQFVSVARSNFTELSFRAEIELEIMKLLKLFSENQEELTLIHKTILTQFFLICVVAKLCAR